MRYIHNDLMQIGLDIGWIPMAAYVFFVGKTLLSRRVSGTKKLILLVIVLHSLFDFDYSFTVLFAIVCIIMEDVTWDIKSSDALTRLKGLLSPLKKNRNGIPVGWFFAVLLLASAYMTVPFTAAYMGDSQLAVSRYPWYTDEQLKLLSQTEDTEEAEELADRILSQNDTCALAYEAKAMVAYIRDDYDGVIRWQREAIKRDYFNYGEYLNFAYMLYDGMVTGAQEDTALYLRCREALKEIPEYLAQAEEKLSRLGSMIDDQPELSVDETLEELLEAAY